MTTRNTEKGLLRKALPVDFHISGYNRNKDSENDVCEAISLGDMTAICPTIAVSSKILRVATPLEAISIEQMLLSIKMTFDASEPNPKFQLGLSTTSAALSASELSRQTKILRSGVDEHFLTTPGGTINVYNIPLHNLLDLSTAQRHYFLTVSFITTPVSGYDLTRFNIKGSVQVGSDFDYKIK